MSLENPLLKSCQQGEFVGVEEDKYPRDFATLIRYYTELQRKISTRYPLPEPLTLEQLDTFIQEAGVHEACAERNRFPDLLITQT